MRAVIQDRYRPSGFRVSWSEGLADSQASAHFRIHVVPQYPGADTPSASAFDAGGSSWEDEQALIQGGSDPFLPHLWRQLDQCRHVDIAVAFVQYSGLKQLIPQLEDLIERGGNVRILTGDYFDVSDPDALQWLLDLSLATDTGKRLSLRIFETGGRGSFHPKAYIFRGDGGSATAYVGSSNISRTAFNEGIEWNYRILQARDSSGMREVSSAFERLWTHVQTRVVDQPWLDTYRARRLPVVAPLEVSKELPPPPPEPHDVQRSALRRLEATRAQRNAAGLVVLATGLGKTWLSAFDSHRPEFPRVLFVAHREEILSQALHTFRRIRPNAHLGLYTGAEKVPDAEVLFAAVQTLSKRANLRNFDRDRFDYIIVDEFHHAAAATYRRLIDHFTPKFLLGLTATPERTDGGDLLGLCQENLVYRCDLFEGIAKGYLSAFRYFGVPDDIDYAQIPWRSSRFDESALTEAAATQSRAANAFEQWGKHGGSGTKTLGFCCSMRHADFMAEYFADRGVRAVAVHSGSSSAPRTSSLERLRQGDLDVVFAVDMFNEGVDLPEVDTILMLRPTESRVLWLQQFGRGLRKSEGKRSLTVVDYIGNHRIFLLKPQALLGIGSDRRDLARALDQYEVGLLELPPGCEVTYELEALALLRSQVGPMSSAPEALRTFYSEFKERTGRRPTASEAFHEGYSPRSVRPSDGSWIGFVANQGDLEPSGQGARAAAGEFLSCLETTPMVRSYKMTLPLAMLNRDALPGSVAIDELTDEFARISARSARVREDVSVELEDRSALRTMLEQDPIRAWVTGDDTDGTKYFAYSDRMLRFLTPVPEASRSAFQELVRELLEWRLAEYLRSNPQDLATAGFECKVSQAGDEPLLQLPSRDQATPIPVGWTPLEIDATRVLAKFDQTQLDELRDEAAPGNRLPEILRDWFGPDAGMPGTDHRVVFRKRESGWSATPASEAGFARALRVGRSYRREDVAAAFGTTYKGQTWQSGIVPVADALVLFVTLNKNQMSEKSQYKDHFISGEVFEWQSQNQTAQRGKVGQKISRHRELGVAIHLFVRKEGKERGRTMPFYYCGLLDFLEWEGEKPITVKWRLREPLSGGLQAHLSVTG